MAKVMTRGRSRDGLMGRAWGRPRNRLQGAVWVHRAGSQYQTLQRQAQVSVKQRLHSRCFGELLLSLDGEWIMDAWG